MIKETTLQDLEKRRDALVKENTNIKEDLYELIKYSAECDRIEKIYGKANSRGGNFGRIRNLPDFKEHWIKSSFWKYHSDISRYNSLPMDIVEKKLMEFRSHNGNILDTFTCRIVAYCDMAIWTPRGALLYLIDPFIKKELFISDITSEDMNGYVGSMLCLHCMEKQGTKNLKIFEIEKLPYTLYDKL